MDHLPGDGILDARAERKEKGRPAEADDAATPGPARLYALLAGAFLALLGVLGFFYDAEFGTGENLASDDLSGLLLVNGWRNVIYLATGVIALATAPRWPRRTAFGLGLFYLAFAIWGFDQTERDIGSLLDTIPLGDKDNALHLALGILGLGAALIDGPLPKLPERLQPRKPKNLKAPKLGPRRKKKTAEEPGRKLRDLPRPRPRAAKPAKTPGTPKPSRDERGSRVRRRADPRPGDAS